MEKQHQQTMSQANADEYDNNQQSEINQETSDSNVQKIVIDDDRIIRLRSGIR